LNAWRKIMYMTALIGQDPARYGGYGFGNISCRLDDLEAASGSIRSSSPARRPAASQT
jgi:hypothetical protein